VSDKNSLGEGNTESSLGAPAYVIALDRAVVLRLAAYGVLLLFLSAGVVSRCLVSFRPLSITADSFLCQHTLIIQL
jgi:hypothetical protein